MRFLFIFMMTIICFIGFSGCDADSDNLHKQNSDIVKLSSLSEAECAEILAEYGVSIPEELSGIHLLELVSALEENPDRTWVISWDIPNNFVEDVRDAVRAYYALEPACS